MPVFTIQERTRQLSKHLLQLLVSLSRGTQTDRTRIDQCVRSGTSIGANIIEAQYAATRKQFMQYYRIALRSSCETEYWLELLALMHTDRADEIHESSEETRIVSRILTTILRNENNRK